MKFARYATMLAAAAGLFASCQELDEVNAFPVENQVAPVLHALPAEIVITNQNMGEGLTFTWDAADFGVQTQINYAVEVAYGQNAAPREILSGLTGTSGDYLFETLNNVLVNEVGVPADTPSEVNFYVSAAIGSAEKLYSEAVPVQMTVTMAERTYPSVKVVGDYCGWNHNNAQRLFSFAGDEVVYSAMIDFNGKAANGFKVSAGEDNWTDTGNWGLDGEAEKPAAESAEIQLINSGGSSDIKIYSKRFYRFTFDRGSMKLATDLSFDQIGVIGDFNGWGGDVVMQFDAAKQRFWADVEFPADGKFKFRVNGAWDVSFGSKTEGLLDSGDDIHVKAGNYRIYANLNNPAEMTYELNADDYGQGGGTTEPDPGPDPDPEVADWYVHGQTGTADWTTTPMETVVKNDQLVAYCLRDITVLPNSEFLFKSGDETQWIGPASSLGGNPYPCPIGSSFAVSTDKVNGMVTDAGTYDYWLLPDAGVGYVMATGVKPEYLPETWGLVGNITDWGNVLGDLSMTEEGAYFVRRGVKLNTASEFKIRFNNEWNDARNYGTESGGTVDLNTAVKVVSSGGSQNMKVQLDGTYDIYFDLANTQIYVMTSGKTPADAQ